RLVPVRMGERLQRALEVVAGALERVLDRGVAPGLVAVARQGRAEPGLHLQAEALLEVGVAPKAELGDESGDRRRADPRALGEPGHALQAGERVRGQEDPSQPPLGRTQRVEALADDLSNSMLRNSHYRHVRLGWFWHGVDNPTLVARNLVANR